jgi:hypothetical protein
MKIVMVLFGFVCLTSGTGSASAADTTGKVRLCPSGGNERTKVINLLIHNSKLEGATGSLIVPLTGPFIRAGDGCVITLATSTGTQIPAKGAKWSADIVYQDVTIDMDNDGKTRSSVVRATVTAEALENFAPTKQGK